MSGTFNISLNDKGDMMKVGFGEPGTNQDIIRDAVQSLHELKESWPNIGGTLLTVDNDLNYPCVEFPSVTPYNVYKKVQ